MLTLERDRQYLVYPSWAVLPYRWEKLPQLLADPRKSGFLHGSIPDDRWTNSHPIDYQSGPTGGGVITVHQTKDAPPPDPANPTLSLPINHWLGSLVLASEANLRMPNGCGLAGDAFGLLVTYLEPYPHHEEVELGLRKKPKLHLCAATPEHAQAAGESVYWLASLDRRKRRPDLTGVPTWAAAFGLRVTEVADLPAALRAETADWFLEPGAFDNVWWQVTGRPSLAGWHFAVLVWLALHARSVVKPLRAMHLVARIEGRPGFRKTWARRWNDPDFRCYQPVTPLTATVGYARGVAGAPGSGSMMSRIRSRNLVGATLVVLGSLAVAACGHAGQGSGDKPRLTREEREAIIRGAQKAVQQHYMSDNKAGKYIAKEHWGEAIAALKPVGVYNDHANVAIVLRDDGKTEEGLYIVMLISSYAPGVDGRFQVLEKLSGADEKGAGTLYRYRIKKE